jgi:enoyl-CoA hydratase
MFYSRSATKCAFVLIATDCRISIEGVFKIGLNEVAIGMPMYLGGVELDM